MAARKERIGEITDASDARTRERTQVIGFDHHLVKPASLDDILNIVSAR